jgi:hypothetical protein
MMEAMLRQQAGLGLTHHRAPTGTSFEHTLGVGGAVRLTILECLLQGRPCMCVGTVVTVVLRAMHVCGYSCHSSPKGHVIDLHFITKEAQLRQLKCASLRFPFSQASQT